MSKELDARISLLDTQLQHAVVEQTTDNEDGPQTFTVFVPGAVREHNTVTAVDEAEAKQKVRGVLVSKLTHYDSKAQPTGPDTQLEVQNGTLSPHAENAGGDKK